jgi:hypothetical protein
MLTNHEKFVEALKDKVGQTFSTSEIKSMLMKRFGNAINPGSILPNDHAEGNKSACWCAGTDQRIFDKVVHGLYTVRTSVRKNRNSLSPVPRTIKNISIDVQRGRRVAEVLYTSFRSDGIFGRKDMPEDIRPRGVRKGSYEHLLFITLTVAIDYQRDAPSLWDSSRKTFEDTETRYLFNPFFLYKTPTNKIVGDMQKYNLSKKPNKDAEIWRTIGVTFYKKWKTDPRNFLQDCDWDSLKILERLKSNYRDYPNLRGPKIGPLWLRMLRDNIGIKNLKNLEKVPIPVDVHIARATLTTGVVRGQTKIKLDELFEYARKAWFESVRDLVVNGKRLIALDIDEPLWNLSKYGCSKNRDKTSGECWSYDLCVAKEFCVKGKISIEDNIIDLRT